MAKGIVLVELDIEKQIINDLTKVEGLLVHLPTIQANLTDSLRRLHEVLVLLGKLRNLEYREAASQKWKKWETEVQNGIEDSLQKVIQAIHRENTNVSVLYIQSAIRELRKLTHYELRIGG